jgi:hypothetical protein
LVLHKVDGANYVSLRANGVRAILAERFLAPRKADIAKYVNLCANGAELDDLLLKAKYRDMM